MENTDITSQIQALQGQVDSLSSQFYKNNFSSHQDFNKSSSFNTALKVPVFTTLPAGEVGQICAYSNAGTVTLQICVSINPTVWQKVGSQ